MIGMFGDKLILVRDGKEVESLKGSVQKEKIYITLPQQVIEEGDVLKRKILNSEEFFLVKSSYYQQGLRGIPSHYSLEVKKIKSLDEVNLEDKQRITTQIVNIHTLNAQNSQIGNGNTINIYNTKIDNQLNELIEEIKKQSFSKDEEKEYLEIVEEIKEQLQKEIPKKSIVKTLLGTLPALGNIASIGSMIVALLG
ncbi:MAG: hypothetical protein NTZ60_01455 [Campylobacterales bacterium]|nr:hypothetical protein [Campylobacterales bacterium]